MKTFLLELRDAAKLQRDPKIRKQLRDIADGLAASIDRFHECPTAAALADVNGKWAYAYRINKYQPPVDDPSGGKGLKESAALAA